MKVSPYLVIGNKGAVRVTKTLPGLAWNEIAFQLHLQIPDELFKKPRLEAKIVVPDSAVRPAKVSAQVMDDIAEAVRKQTGIEVRLWVEPEQIEEPAA
jgi:hypothetical protein